MQTEGRAPQGAAPRQGRRRNTNNRPSDDQLLDAACAVFVTAGFHGASMERIANEADATKPTLYAHFGSKDALYQACLRREADNLTEWLFTTYESATDLAVEDMLHTDMRAFYDYAAAHPDGFGLLFDEHTLAANSQIRDEVTCAITDRVTDQIRAAYTRRGRPAPGASAELLAAMIVGIAIHGARHALHAGNVDTTTAGELATSMAYFGLRHLDRDVMHIIDDQARG